MCSSCSLLRYCVNSAFCPVSVVWFCGQSRFHTVGTHAARKSLVGRTAVSPVEGLGLLPPPCPGVGGFMGPSPFSPPQPAIKSTQIVANTIPFNSLVDRRIFIFCRLILKKSLLEIMIIKVSVFNYPTSNILTFLILYIIYS